MQRLQRMAHEIALDDAAGQHHGLGRPEATLPVLIVDERQDARVLGGRLLAASRVIVLRGPL